jgi:hypothetical protein
VFYVVVGDFETQYSEMAKAQGIAVRRDIYGNEIR